jgi:two-component system OmpR family response regulator
MRPEFGRRKRDGPVAKRVLVVDDDTDQLMALVSYLRYEGYSVQMAYNGLDGLKLATQWRPDFVLLDIGLPDLDGYEVARRLRADPETKSAKLIAVTAHGRESDVAKAREVGFDAHITKPLEFRDLLVMMKPQN